MLSMGSINKVELTDYLERVTLLFADIAGFTAYSGSVAPLQVVKMLRSLFEEFDKLCLKFKVYKMYTIGDCYVVMGFNDKNKRKFLDEVKNTINMGFAMINIIANVRKEIKFEKLGMRIGVHTVEF